MTSPTIIRVLYEVVYIIRVSTVLFCTQYIGSLYKVVYFIPVTAYTSIRLYEYPLIRVSAYMSIRLTKIKVKQRGTILNFLLKSSLNFCLNFCEFQLIFAEQKLKNVLRIAKFCKVFDLSKNSAKVLT